MKMQRKATLVSGQEHLTVDLRDAGFVRRYRERIVGSSNRCEGWSSLRECMQFLAEKAMATELTIIQSVKIKEMKSPASEMVDGVTYVVRETLEIAPDNSS